MSDLDRRKTDKHDNLFMTYTITDKTFKATIMNLNSFLNVTINKSFLVFFSFFEKPTYCCRARHPSVCGNNFFSRYFDI